MPYFEVTKITNRKIYGMKCFVFISASASRLYFKVVLDGKLNSLFQVINDQIKKRASNALFSGHCVYNRKEVVLEQEEVKIIQMRASNIFFRSLYIEKKEFRSRFALA